MDVRADPVSTQSVMIKTLRNPHLWVVTLLMVLLTAIHYHEIFAGIPVLDQIGSLFGLGLTRHTLERILFIIPVTYGTVVFGLGGGLSILILVAAAMFGRVFFISTEFRESLFESGGVIVTLSLIVLFIDSFQKGKQRMVELESTQGQLKLQIERLSMLHFISSSVSQSLDLNQILAVNERIRQLMHMQYSWIYLRFGSDTLRLAASSGPFTVERPLFITIGNSIDGIVARTGKSMVIEDSVKESNTAVLMAGNNEFKSTLVVPLTSRGKVLGTLGVGNNDVHDFLRDEVDLLNAIAGQFTLAIDNARLLELERSAANALRVSESNYRELFEKASDAIWVEDTNGRIKAVNNAFERLTGYNREDIIGVNASALMNSKKASETMEETHRAVLRGETVAPCEQQLVRKDGSQVIVQIGISLITSGSEQVIQHIAHDVTEEKREQDNLRLYAQQVSEAQEAERKRIARDLHDDTAQALVAVLRNLEELDSNYAEPITKGVREQVRGILKGVREFSRQLRPSVLDQLGLLPALKWLASEMTKNGSINAEVEVIGETRQLPATAELMLFRIVQEALNNVQKHSGASNVDIRLEFGEKTTEIRIVDNGSGFKVPSKIGDLTRSGKLGLTGMMERVQLLGGTLKIDSVPGAGTTLIIQVPC